MNVTVTQTCLQSLDNTTHVQRLEAVRDSFILRRQEDSRQKQLDNKITKALTISYERHLTNLGIHPDYYDKIYELATLIYNGKEVKGPFGIDDIIQGALKFKKSFEVVEDKTFKLERKVKNPCPICKGTGLKFEKGIIVYDSERKAVKCENCL